MGGGLYRATDITGERSVKFNTARSCRALGYEPNIESSVRTYERAFRRMFVDAAAHLK